MPGTSHALARYSGRPPLLASGSADGQGWVVVAWEPGVFFGGGGGGGKVDCSFLRLQRRCLYFLNIFFFGFCQGKTVYTFAGQGSFIFIYYTLVFNSIVSCRLHHTAAVAGVRRQPAERANKHSAISHAVYITRNNNK